MQKNDRFICYITFELSGDLWLTEPGFIIMPWNWCWKTESQKSIFIWENHQVCCSWGNGVWYFGINQNPIGEIRNSDIYWLLIHSYRISISLLGELKFILWQTYKYHQMIFISWGRFRKKPRLIRKQRNRAEDSSINRVLEPREIAAYLQTSGFRNPTHTLWL